MELAFDQARFFSYQRDMQFAAKVGYKYEEIKYQRVLGPPIYFLPDSLPDHGCEVFVLKLPKDVGFDYLLPFFSKVGNVYQIRLMMHVSLLSNRGFAFVTYFKTQDAIAAVNILNGECLWPHNPPIRVFRSLDNRRLFIGGILNSKSRDEVWKELIHQEVIGVVDVIMYRSYTNRSHNRGFVFVEFNSHRDAAEVRSKCQNLTLFGMKVVVDWSVPIPPIDNDVLKEVTNIYIRNLPVALTRDVFKCTIESWVDPGIIQKIYKFKDYAFVHFKTRKQAEDAMKLFQKIYSNTDVEVTWAKPPSVFTKPWYRKKQISNLNQKRQKLEPRTRMDSTSSSYNGLPTFVPSVDGLLNSPRPSTSSEIDMQIEQLATMMMSQLHLDSF